jgi:hypothetical protein
LICEKAKYKKSPEERASGDFVTYTQVDYTHRIGGRVKNRFVFVCVFVASVSIGAEQVPQFSHDVFDRVLKQFVNASGLVDYTGLQAHPEDLKTYLALLAQYSPDATPERFPSRADSLAYWINAYNAFAISGVIEAYPVKSVRDIKWLYGFFNRTRYVAGGTQLTLKHIENEIVRKVFQDPRIHAALNCASMGCPRLPQRAFRPETLQEDLEDDMQTFLNEQRNVRIDRTEKRIYLSNILKVFGSDFTDWYTQNHPVVSATVLDYLQLYLPQDDAQYLKQHPNLKIQYIDYDWRLNDQIFKRE